MRSNNRRTSAGARRGSPTGLGARLALAGVLLAGATTLALADRPESTPPDGGMAMDDEAIGSLPMLGGAVDFLPLGFVPAGLEPSLYLEGPTGQVLRGLLGATGHATVSITPSGAGRSTFVFRGAFELDVDMALLADPHVEVGLVTGAELGHVAAGMFHQGRLVQRAVVAPEARLEVPVAALIAHDALKWGVDVFTIDGFGDRDHYRIDGAGGVASLRSRLAR